MADILSQEEIDALLDVVDDEGDDVLEGGDEGLAAQRQVTLYDFKSSNHENNNSTFNNGSDGVNFNAKLW